MDWKTELEALEEIADEVFSPYDNKLGDAIRSLRTALAEPQEPVGWFESPHGDFRANPLYKMKFPSTLLAWQIPLFIAPPQRPAEPEPVAWKDKTYGNLHHQDFGNSIPLYTALPQRPFVGLTLEEVEDIIKSNVTITDQRLYEGVYAVAVDIEAKLREKNT